MPPPQPHTRRNTMLDNPDEIPEEHRQRDSFGSSRRLVKGEPWTSWKIEKRLGTRSADSLNDMEDETFIKHVVMFARPVDLNNQDDEEDQSSDYDAEVECFFSKNEFIFSEDEDESKDDDEDQSDFAGDECFLADDECLFVEDECFFAEGESFVAPVPTVASTSSSVPPPRPNNPKERRPPNSFGLSKQETMYEPSTSSFTSEKRVATSVSLDSLSEIEDTWDGEDMSYFIKHMLAQSAVEEFDKDDEDEDQSKFAGDECFLADDECLFVEDESCFFPPVQTVSPTSPPPAHLPHRFTMDNPEERRPPVSFGPSRQEKYKPSTSLTSKKRVAAAQLDHSAVQAGESSPALQSTRLPKIPRKRPECGGASWTKQYVQLQLYKDMHGDCLVPQKCKEYPKLGGWVNLQRVEYRKTQQGKTISQMTEYRMKKLNTLGFVWDMYETAWTERYKELVKYEGKYGDCIVPRLYKEYPKLGEWVKKQKQEYRKKSRRMTQDRFDKLVVLGFVWGEDEGERNYFLDTYETAWTERYKELVKYKGKHGDCIVPRLYKEYPKLGEWVSTQRKLYRGKCSREIYRERFDKLEALSFAWTAVRKGSSRGDAGNEPYIEKR
jgi:hypothetical protein